MNRTTCLSLVALAACGLSQVAAAWNLDDAFLEAYGQFELDSGQTRTLAHGNHERAYRICVEDKYKSVPLKVMHDGAESTIYPGNCSDIEGMHVQIAPGGKMDPRMVLVGKIEHVPEDSSD